MVRDSDSNSSTDYADYTDVMRPEPTLDADPAHNGELLPADRS
jgi:hypothetical protein